MTWRIFAASAIGSSPREDGRPCQDAFAHCSQGEVLCAVICDGAGSCESSHIGARFVANAVTQALVAHAAAGGLGLGTDGDALRTLIEGVVAGVRKGLQATAASSSRELSDFASTLVGVVGWPSRGHFFHVGDGFAVARTRGAEARDIVSLPDNGEYVNETYFVTGDEWRAHLRTESFTEPIATVALMSDGAAPFAMAKGQQALHDPFIVPVLRYLDQVTEAEGSEALGGTLADPRTDAISTDDKTLLIARWV